MKNDCVELKYDYRYVGLRVENLCSTDISSHK